MKAKRYWINEGGEYKTYWTSLLNTNDPDSIVFDSTDFWHFMERFAEHQNKELIEICTKLIDANKRESIFETIEWTDELENYLLKINKK